MPVTDNRTLASNADTTTGWGGGWAVDTETVIEGSASLATSQTSLTTEQTNLYNFSSAQDFSDTVWYMWFNCAVAAFLKLEANGGITMRFTGPTQTNWIEFDIAGNDTYTGGWKQAVVDIEKTPSRTGGTPPLTNAIQYVGVVIGGLLVRPRMQDNMWNDAMWYIKKDKAATTVYGGNSGWDQVIATASLGAWGTVKRGPGGSVVLNGGVQFGTSSNEDTLFADSNQVILWEDNEVPDDYYKIVVTGSTAGTIDFEAGTKVGTGDTAVGISGWVVAAASGSDRFDLDISSLDIDSASFYSSNFQHGRVFNLENSISEFVSCQFSDVSAVTQSSETSTDTQIGSKLLSNTFLNFDVIPSSSLIYVYTPEKIDYCSFVGGTGHAINITQSGSYTFTGNKNSEFGGNEDGKAFLLNSSDGEVTMSISDGGDGVTYRNVGSSTTQVVNTITLTLTNIINDSEIRIYTGSTSPPTELAGQESVTTGEFEYVYEYVPGQVVDIVIFKENYKINEPDGGLANFTLQSSNASIPISQQFDRNYIGGVDIFVILGQSNAVGLAKIEESEDAIKNWSTDSRHLIWDQTNFIASPLVIGTNNNLGCPEATGSDFGVEMPIVVNQQFNSRGTLIIKSATYGSSLHVDWNPFTGSNQYETAWTAVASAKAILGDNYGNWNFLWLQGEEDAKGIYGGGVEFYYETYLTQLITGMRFFCGDSNAPFVCAKLDDLDLFVDPILFPDMDLVNTAMDNVAFSGSNIYAVESTFWDREIDIVHFNAVGIVEAGDDMTGAII